MLWCIMIYLLLQFLYTGSDLNGSTSVKKRDSLLRYVGYPSFIMHSFTLFLIDSLQVCEQRVLCAESVPGFALVEDEYSYAHDTVWLSTSNHR